MIDDRQQELIRKELEKDLRFDEKTGLFNYDIESDRDCELSKETLTKIFNADDPRFYFEMWLHSNYDDCICETEFQIFNKIQQIVGLKDENGEDIWEWIYNNVLFNLPEDSFLDQIYCCNILVDTGDGNYDHTINQPFASYNAEESTSIDEDSSLLWFAKQQGYTKGQLNRALRDSDFRDSKFLKSVRNEVANVTTEMNALVFLIKLSLREILTITEVLKGLKRDKYHPRRSRERGFILIRENVTCGLVDFWSGAGSVLEIQPEKKIKLPLKYIHSIEPDGVHGYSIKEIYGVTSELWRNNAILETKLK